MKTILYTAKDTNGNWIEGLPYYSNGLGEWKISHSNRWIPSYSNPDEGESTLLTNIDSETICQYVRDDINGKPIFEHQKFTFNYIVGIDDFDKLTGSFAYSDEELRFEIDIWHSDEYTYISYNPVLMYNFQLIEDNPSL